MPRKIIYFFCLILFSVISAGAIAQTSPDFPKAFNIKDPVFVSPEIYPKELNGKGKIYINLNVNMEMCEEHYGRNKASACYQNLHMQGKKALSGISVYPEVNGDWRWESDYGLVFTPDNYWSAHKEYRFNIDLDKLNVPERVLFPGKRRKEQLGKYTSPLEIKIEKMAYMQDPEDPERKLVSAKLKSNYPVIRETFEDRLSFSLEKNKGHKLVSKDADISYELTFDNKGMNANIAMILRELPDKEKYLKMSIGKGVEPVHGGDSSTSAFRERARVPSLSTYLSLKNASDVIVRKEDGTPSQVLSIETNVKALPSEVLRNVSLYLLPYDHPVMARDKDFKSEAPYRWKGANEVTPSILESAEKLSLAPMPENTTEVTQFGFAFHAPKGRYLYLSVEPGLKAFGGYTLEGRYEKVIKVRGLPSDIEIMHEGSILTLSGSKKLSLHARGTDKLMVEVAKISGNFLQHFISQTEGDITSPSFKNWSFGREDFGREDIAEIETREIDMAYVSDEASQYAAFDFSPYLAGGDKGVFLLNIKGMKGKKSVGSAEQRFVLVTDFGLLVKHNADASCEVFLSSFTTGKPVSSADVSVLSKNGMKIFTGKTDEDGHLSFPSFAGYERDKDPVAIVAEKDGDYTFIPYFRYDRLLNNSRFDVGGHSFSDGIGAFVFSDRGIYRPGETVHIGLMVKNSDFRPLPPSLPLTAVITDPAGKVIKEENISFSGSGLAEISFDTKTSWRTGYYYASLYIGRNEGSRAQLGGTSVRVEEFVPDRLKIKGSIFEGERKIEANAGWYKFGDIKSEVILTNLYGTPASEREIKTTVSLGPVDLSFSSYPDYEFFDSYAASGNRDSYVLPIEATDENGRAVISIDLGDNEKSTYYLGLETTGYEAGSGRGVTVYNSAIVSPMDYVIGYSSKDNLGYLKKGGDYKLDLIALDPDLKPVAVEDLFLSLSKINYITTLIKRSDGSYAYEATPKEELVSKADYSIVKEGSSLSMPSDTIGDYILSLSSKEGRKVSEIKFSVAGEGQRKSEIDRETILIVKTDKSMYKPGDKMELNISSPYTGAGLITLETDKVLAWKWFETDKTDTIQSIDIPEDFYGKGYVDVTFVRNINSKEIYLNPLSHAIIPFSVEAGSHELTIDLSVPEKAVPGEPMEIKYKGNQKGRAAIFAVDEGILQVAGYNTPDPVHRFLFDRALQVQTFQMLDLLMPEYSLVRSLSANGGGGEWGDAASLLGEQLNPFARKILAPAVYWAGIVDIDETEKTLTFTPPGHFNGTLRVMAVSAGKSSAGSADKKVTVRSDIVLTPNVPFFLAPGDKTTASVTIANGIEGSGDSAEISLLLKPSSGMTIISQPENSVKIPEGSERSVSFVLQATEDIGPAELDIEVSYGDVVQTVQATLSIRPPVAKETTITSGYIEKGRKAINLERDMYPDLAERELSVSSLPMSYVFGLMSYLDTFPYGCSEQITSKVFPALALSAFPEFSFRHDETIEKVERTVSSLRSRQVYDGSFSTWRGVGTGNDFITVYVMDFLLEARDNNVPVPSDMLRQGISYLRDWTNQNIDSMEDARNKAYGIYVLTRSGIVTTNEILHWLKYFEDRKSSLWKTDISALYIAASYEMMQQKSLAVQTIRNFEKGFEGKEPKYEGEYLFNSFIKYSQYISVVARYFPEMFADIDRDIVFRIAGYISANRYNTLSASYMIRALSDYAALQQKEIKSEGVKVYAKGEEVLLTGDKILKTFLPVDIGSLDLDAGSQPLFYAVSETGFTKPDDGKAVMNGIEVERTYLDENGDPLEGPVRIGDVITALVKIRSYEDQKTKNVAIVDLLPGGFALEPGEYDNMNYTLNPDFVDRREDRIIIFSDIMPYDQTYKYSLRAISIGDFVTPSVYAEAMYDLSKTSRGTEGVITVSDEAE